MRHRLQPLLDLERAYFLGEALRSYVQRIGFPPYARRDLAKNLSMFS